MINISVLQKEIEHCRRCSKDDWLWIAGVVAGDILRHLNPAEKAEAAAYLSWEYPRLAEILRRVYPYRWVEPEESAA